MDKPCTNDKDEFPDDEVLSRYLGKVKTVWDSFMDFLKDEYPSFTGEWRYYNDGKSWLYKLTKKKKLYAGFPFGIICLRLLFIFLTRPKI